MTTDNKTLADVQPGGRVRLGDQLPPLPKMEHIGRVVGMGPHDTWYEPVAYTAEQMQDYARAALAARQPVGEPVPFAVESKAFETHAASRDLNLVQHPLHYLFLDPVTVEARRAWKAALAFARPAQAVDHEVTDAMVDKAWNRFEAALHADDGDTPEDRVLSETIDQRDRYHEMADELAGHIARIIGVDIGEHSSANCPWQNAIEAAEEYKPAQAVDLRALRDAVQGITVGFDGDLPYIKGIAEALALINKAVGNK